MDETGLPISGVQFAITQGSGQNEQRNDAMTDAAGEFIAFMPLSVSVTWDVSYTVRGGIAVPFIHRRKRLLCRRNKNSFSPGNKGGVDFTPWKIGSEYPSNAPAISQRGTLKNVFLSHT